MPQPPQPAILVVEDDATVLQTTARLLCREGYQVRQAQDPHQARQELRAAVPELILLDVVLDAASGVELCREIKTTPGWADAFVILISGLRTSSDEQADGLEALADGYIARPIGNRELLARLEAYLRIHRTQQRLVRAERYRAVADLALGVSHNLNNLLTGIIGPLHLMRRRTDDPRLLREVDAVAAAAERARVLVQRLERSVNGLSRVLLEPVDVARVVQETLAQAGRAWTDGASTRGITVKPVLTTVPPVRALAAELTEALSQLLDNAAEAMPAGGTITIETRSEEDHVLIAVGDTGRGMDAETLQRAAEPLFSSKGTVGAGLGLSLVSGAVQRWGGTLDLDSKPGVGTTVTMALACWEEPQR